MGSRVCVKLQRRRAGEEHSIRHGEEEISVGGVPNAIDKVAVQSSFGLKLEGRALIEVHLQVTNANVQRDSRKVSTGASFHTPPKRSRGIHRSQCIGGCGQCACIYGQEVREAGRLAP